MAASNHEHARTGPERIVFTRRRFLVLASSCIATLVTAGCGGSDDDRRSTATATASSGAGRPAEPTGSKTPGPIGTSMNLERFMQVSRVLTAFDDLDDTESGEIYLEALLGDQMLETRLGEQWTAGGFGDAVPPASLADLDARGVFQNVDLVELADTITGNWYSGTYMTNGEPRVATYTNALAWDTLGYRPLGPSTCGGAFAYWSSAPSA